MHGVTITITYGNIIFLNDLSFSMKQCSIRKSISKKVTVLDMFQEKFKHEKQLID